jgi:hypothetical protein
MRRIWFLLIFLLLAQQGAVIHAVSHASPEKSTPLEHVCDQCLAYTGAASGAASGHGVLAPDDLPSPFSAAFSASHHSATPLAFSSRAPPRLL